MIRRGTDPVIQAMQDDGTPLTKANWLMRAFPDGAPAEYDLPPEVGGLDPAEVLPEFRSKTTSTGTPTKASGEREFSRPHFARGLQANYEKRKAATSKKT